MCPKNPTYVVSYKGVEVGPNLAIAVPMTRREQKGMTIYYFLGWILGTWLALLGLIFLLQPTSNEFTLRKYEAPYNLPNISSAKKSSGADGHGKFEVVCRQRDILLWLRCLATANKLHGTKSAQEKMHLEDPKQNRDNHLKSLRVRRDTTNYEDYDDYIDFHGNSSSCKLPTGLKTAEILCKFWANSISCKSYCEHGSTYKEGIVRTHVCKYKENEWSKKFEECKPFLDCYPKLVNPGNIECLEARIEESTTCEISCETNELEDDMNSAWYECKSDGTWDPPLPNCAALRGMPLVEAPKVTKHGNLSYPRDEEME